MAIFYTNPAVFLLLYLCLFFSLSAARHRPDIFQDDLTLREALDNIKVAYSPVQVAQVEPDLKTFAGVLEQAANVGLTFGAELLVEATLFRCGAPGQSALSSTCGQLRKNCPKKFEDFCVEMTTVYRDAVVAKIREVMRQQQQVVLNGQQTPAFSEKQIDRVCKAYLDLVALQERVARALPILPVMSPLVFLAVLIIAALLIIGFVWRCLKGCLCCCLPF